MPKLSYEVDGRIVWLERKSPEEIGLFREDYFGSPFDTVSVPRLFRRARHVHGKGHWYAYRLTWLVENVPYIQASIEDKIKTYTETSNQIV